jgi:hypothetical protein
VKAWGYVALVVAVIAILGGTYWLGYSHTKPPIVNNYTTNAFTIADSIPASVKIVNMVTPTGEPIQTEYATMDTMLTSPSGNSRVALGIGYNEYSNLFNLKANFSETLHESNSISKPKFLTPTASLMFGYRQFDDAIPERLGIGAGVKIMDKYSIQLTADTDKTYGITLGVDL